MASKKLSSQQARLTGATARCPVASSMLAFGHQARRPPIRKPFVVTTFYTLLEMVLQFSIPTHRQSRHIDFSLRGISAHMMCIQATSRDGAIARLSLALHGFLQSSCGRATPSHDTLLQGPTLRRRGTVMGRHRVQNPSRHVPMLVRGWLERWVARKKCQHGHGQRRASHMCEPWFTHAVGGRCPWSAFRHARDQSGAAILFRSRVDWL